MLAFFYFDVNGEGEQGTAQMLRSILSQLCSGSAIAVEILHELYTNCAKGVKSPTTKQLSETLKEILGRLDGVIIVLDALDECDSSSQVVHWLDDIYRSGIENLHLLVTSRKHGAWEKTIESWPSKEQTYAIGTDDVNIDISNCVHARLFHGKEFEKWISQEGLREEVEKKILHQANGM